MRRLLQVLIMVTSLSGMASAAAGKEPRSEPLPVEVVRAWRAAGAEVGWWKPMQLNDRGFRVGMDGQSGEVPAFRFEIWPSGTAAKLPPPPRVFGLVLDDPNVTDARLKELAGLKNLQTLGLVRTRVTGIGLEELAGLPNLQVLELGRSARDASRLGKQEFVTPLYQR